MDIIYLPELLKAPNQTEVFEINELISGLDTLTPVRGKVQVTHRGTYLEVTGQLETIVTLECHRCLQHYNQRLKVDKTELIWLDETPQGASPIEQELSEEGLLETLSAQGHFDPNIWVYEQLSLEFPLQQSCGENCAGIPQTKQTESHLIDQRWSGLEQLKHQLMQNDDS